MSCMLADNYFGATCCHHIPAWLVLAKPRWGCGAPGANPRDVPHRAPQHPLLRGQPLRGLSVSRSIMV